MIRKSYHPCVSAVDVRAVRVFELGEGQTAWPTVALCLTALAVQAASSAAAITGVWPTPIAIAINTSCAYAQFTVLHDALHRSASRAFWLNELLGYTATFVLCGPYAAIRRNHLHHHAHTNDPQEDPDFWVAGTTWGAVALRCLTMLQMHYWSYLTRLRRRDSAYAQSVATIALILTAAAPCVRRRALRIAAGVRDDRATDGAGEL